MPHTIRWILANSDQRVAAFAMPATCEPEGYSAEKRKGNVRSLAGRRESGLHHPHRLCRPRPPRRPPRRHRRRPADDRTMTGRIAVIGSNMVDLVTYVTRMPVRGETVEAPSFEMGHGGKGANQAVAAAKLGADGDDGHQGRRRHVRRQHDPQPRRLRRRHAPRRARAGPLERRRAHHGRAVGRELDPDRQGRQRRPLAGRHRARRRRSEDLRPDPAAARNPGRDRLCGDRLRQAARHPDAAQPGARGRRPRSRAHPRRHVPRPQRDRARHPVGPAGRDRGGDRGGGAQPDRQGHRRR